MKKGFAIPFSSFFPGRFFSFFAFFDSLKTSCPEFMRAGCFAPSRCRRFNEKNRFIPEHFIRSVPPYSFSKRLSSSMQRTDDIAITRASGHRFPAENPPSFIRQKPHDAGNIRPAAPRTPGSSSDGNIMPDRRMEEEKRAGKTWSASPDPLLPPQARRPRSATRQ